MRYLIPFACVAALSACASSSPSSFASMVGAGNTAALDAAVACNMDEALQLAKREANSSRPEVQLVSQFSQAAIYTDLGQTEQAAAAVDLATSDKGMNPNGASRSDMQQGADALLQAIQGRRTEATGSPSC